MFGPDPWPNGVSANRKNPEQFKRYSFFQGLIPQKLTGDGTADAFDGWVT